jgi:pimeloyl-ACP methyl ester carboxylesterase
MPTAEVNGARLWYEEAGEGPAVVLVHGGLGDARLWEPEFRPLAERFRTIRFDQRFFGRSTGPAAPFSFVDDALGLLDELAVTRAALVGLSFGGRVAFDAALAAPERCWAVAGVAPALSGHDSRAVTEEQDAAYEAAVEAGDLDAAMAVDFEVWAPLGADERMRELWLSTPDADPLPPGVDPRSTASPALPRLGELAVPTLVVTARHDPPGMREIGPIVERDAPNARHVEVDSDHYLTLREPEPVTRLLVDFLTEAAPTAS